MVVTEFKIVLDKEVYFAGDHVTGKVHLVLQGQPLKYTRKLRQ